MRTHAMTFERDDGSEMTVEYTISPYDPGVHSGPPERCRPPEGGEAEIVDARGPDGPIELTDEEVDLLTSRIQESHAFDEEVDWGPDPDEAYDRRRDGW